MADISIVDGQGDTLNLHINVKKNTSTCSIENKDSFCDKSISDCIYSKDIKDRGGDSEEVITEATLSPRTTSPDHREVTNVNTLETNECFKTLQQVADICETSNKSPDGRAQPDCAEQSECGDVHLNLNSETLVAENKCSLLDISDNDKVETNNECVPNGVQVPLINSCLAVKEAATFDSANSPGDQLAEEGIQINSSDKNSLSNVLGESISSSKSDEAVACVSIDASPSDDRVMEEQANTDLTEQTHLSKDDLLNEHTDNQEETVCESNVHQSAISDEVEMSEIKIAESLTDSNHVNNVNLINTDSEKKGNFDLNNACGVDFQNSACGVNSPNTSNCVDGLEVSECENDKVSDDNVGVDGCENSELGIVILESTSIAELGTGKETLFSETYNSSIDSSEELMEHDVSKGKLDEVASVQHDSVADTIHDSRDEMLDDSPACLVIEEDMEVTETIGDKLEDQETSLDCHDKSVDEEALLNSDDTPEGEGISNSDDQLVVEGTLLNSEDKLKEGTVNIVQTLEHKEATLNSNKSDIEGTLNNGDKIESSKIVSNQLSDTDNKTDDITDNKTDDDVIEINNKTDNIINTDNKTDNIIDTDNKTEDIIDMDDEVLLLEDSDTINIMPPKFSFKNILKVPKKDLPIPDTCSDDEDAIIVDETDEVTDQDNISDDKKDQNLIQTENASKVEPTRKRCSMDNDESKESKRPRTDNQASEMKDIDVKDSSLDASPADEKQKTINNLENVKECPSSIQTTTKVLQAFITAHFRAFMKTQKQINTDKLNRRTRAMQTATNLWKETARHLEKSVQELTLVAEKIEKRKSRATELKNMSSRSIGIQVNNTKPKQPPSSPSKMKIQDSTSVSSNPSSVTIPNQQHQSPRLQAPLNNVIQAVGKYSNRSPQNIATPLKKMVPQTPGPPTAVHRNSPSPRQAAAANSRKPMPPSQGKSGLDSGNLIDLTDEDDVSKTVKKTTSKTAVQTTPRPVVNKLNPIPPANGYSTNASLQGGSPALLMAPNNQVMLTPIQNSQILSGPPSTMAPFQLIPINNSGMQAVKGGPMFALLSNQRQPMNAVPVAQNTSPRIVPLAATNTTTNSSTPKSATYSLPQSLLISSIHPAPLPQNQDSGNAPQTAKKRPPKPGLKISRVTQGIVLSWNMPSLNDVEKIASYQLFAYQENENSVPKSSLWKKVGDVKALPLPMACTLTQFQEGNRYHFAVRAVDQYGRCGQYSDASSIILRPKT